MHETLPELMAEMKSFQKSDQTALLLSDSGAGKMLFYQSCVKV